jgi:excisionase family DNA binding protein
MTRGDEQNREPLITTADVAKWLGINKKTVLSFMESGKFPGYRIGNAWKFRESEVRKFIQDNQYTPGQHVEEETE